MPKPIRGQAPVSLLGWAGLGWGQGWGQWLTGIEGVSLLWLGVPEALQSVIGDLEHKASIYHAVG